MQFNIENILSYRSGIYSITNSVDNRFYLGSTINFRKRYLDHRNRLKNKNHNNKYIQAFSNKYGIETFSFNLLFLCKNTCLVYNEKLWIELLKPQFNIKPIVQRPYFDDEIHWSISSVATPLELIFGKTESPYKPIPHLNFIEEIEFRNGRPPSCRYPHFVDVLDGHKESLKIKPNDNPKTARQKMNAMTKQMQKEKYII